LAETASRPALEKALYAYAPPDRTQVVKDLLDVLSIDELRFLAEFLGSCILISSATNMSTLDVIGRAVPMGDDADHKLALAGEFATRCGFVIKIR
jgi:hypothetical protein